MPWEELSLVWRIRDSFTNSMRLARFVSGPAEKVEMQVPPLRRRSGGSGRDDKTKCLSAPHSRLRKRSERRILRGLNFTPRSAKAALRGGPGSPARNNKNKRLRRRPKGRLYQKALFSAGCKARIA